VTKVSVSFENAKTVRILDKKLATYNKCNLLQSTYTWKAIVRF